MLSTKKKEKKETSTAGGTSSFHRTTTVQQSNNGTTITKTTQIKSSTRLESSREERSHLFSTSSPIGRNVLLLGHNNTASNPTLHGIDDFSYTSPYFKRTHSLYAPKLTLSKDASPFTPSRLTTTSNRTAASTPLLSSALLPRTSLNLPSSNTSPYRNINPSSNYISPYGSSPSTLAIQTTPSSVTNNVVPTYENKATKLGKALVINNVKFIEKKDERQGAKKDSDDLEKFLKKINFEVDHKVNMKGKDMLKKIKDFSKTDFSRYSISLVVIMSHGNNLVSNGERVRGGFTQIAGTDNEPVLTEDIIEQFVAINSHPSLKGKPKIFIFQCCRGERDQEVCHDVAPIKNQVKQYADILVAYSTLPGYLSNRDPKSGTWYIQSLCEVFERHHKTHHIEDMLKIVDNKLSSKHPRYTQTSTYENRGFKQCFLYKTS